jgi:hypothetical protein
VRRFINAPSFYEWVIEGDVEDCFGSIHHGLLMAELRRRVTDKRLLRLVRQFLAAGVMREHGSLAATPSGAPQGALISPLLANVALSVLDRHFEAAWNAHSSQERSRRRAQGHPSYRMIRYADDFVVLVHGTRAQAEAIKETAARLLRDQLRLTLSPEKTRITHVDDGFDFLGFRIVRLPRTGRAPAAFSFPSRPAVNRLRHRIKTLTGRSTTSLSLDALLHALNPVLRGWTNYYRHAASKRLLRLPRPLPVDAAGAVAAQEAPAADLEAGPATVLGPQLDEHRGHQALLAHDGGESPATCHAADTPRGQRRGPPCHRSPRHDQRPTRLMRPAQILWRAGCSGTSTSGSEGGGKQTTSRKPGTAARLRPYARWPQRHSRSHLGR